MRARGVPHPATAGTAAEAAAVPGPWVVKPRSGRGSRGVVSPELTPQDREFLRAVSIKPDR